MNKHVSEAPESGARSETPPPRESSKAGPVSDRMQRKPEAAQPRAEPESSPVRKPSGKPQPAAANTEAEPAIAVPNTAGSQRFWTPWRVRAAAFVAALAIGVVIWRGQRPHEPEVRYQVTAATLGTVTRTIHAKGTLAPRNVTDITAATDGRVQAVLVKPGDHVPQGAVLARFDPERPRADLAEAQDNVASEHADVERSQAAVAEARSTLARETVLRDYNIGAPGAYQRAQARLAFALAGVETNRADLREAQLRVADARTKLTRLAVRAPFAGIVLKRNVEPGQYAGGGSQVLFTMAADLSELAIRADIPETALAVVKTGQTATFTVPAYSKRPFTAVVTGIDLLPKSTSGDSTAKSTYRVALVADNPDDVLRPGMSVDLAVITAAARNVVTVPAAAVAFTPPRDVAGKYPPPKPSSTGAAARVWMLTGKRPVPRAVTTGLSDGKTTQITSGLAAGEKVITHVQFASD